MPLQIRSMATRPAVPPPCRITLPEIKTERGSVFLSMMGEPAVGRSTAPPPRGSPPPRWAKTQSGSVAIRKVAARQARKEENAISPPGEGRTRRRRKNSLMVVQKTGQRKEVPAAGEGTLELQRPVSGLVGLSEAVEQNRRDHQEHSGNSSQPDRGCKRDLICIICITCATWDCLYLLVPSQSR